MLASVIAGLLYTITTPTVAFSYVAAWMLIALARWPRPHRPTRDNLTRPDVTTSGRELVTPGQTT